MGGGGGGGSSTYQLTQQSELDLSGSGADKHCLVRQLQYFLSISYICECLFVCSITCPLIKSCDCRDQLYLYVLNIEISVIVYG